ncbi:MAG: DUF1449 family protein [Gammaproteobacteria bacterium]|nr:DUF1449 family protein [Gammaproteobacteria bacterium]
MWELLTADENLAFSVALALMLLLAVLEGVFSLLGAGLSGLLEGLAPELGAELEVHAEAGLPEAENSLTRVLGWLRVGQVPVLMLLVVLLTLFGLCGLGIQNLVQGLAGVYLPGWLAWLPALAAALPLTRLVGGWLHRAMPKDETTAVSADTLVGRIATITLGTARPGQPAEAKARDQHGQTHYFLVEPDGEGESFTAGTQVLLTEHRGTVYRAIVNPNPHLAERPE